MAAGRLLQAAADALLSRVEEAKKVPTVVLGEIRHAFFVLGTVWAVLTGC